MPGRDDLPAEIFQAGLNARVAGKLATDCPYPDQSGEREQWLEGWRKPDDVDEPPELGFA